MNSLVSSLIDIVYPPTCEHCEKEIASNSEVLCVQCLLSLPYVSKLYTDHKIVLDRLNNLIPVEHAYSCFFSSEDNLVQHLIKSFKYQSRRLSGEYLSNKMADNLLQFIHTNKCDFDVLIPVPIHRQKKLRRGYNQSEIITKILGSKLNMPVVDSVLTKSISTKSQTTKSRIMRMNLEENVFDVSEDKSLHGKHFLLIDDILTIGATLEKCVNKLRSVYKTSRFSIATLAISTF